MGSVAVSRDRFSRRNFYVATDFSCLRRAAGPAASTDREVFHPENKPPRSAGGEPANPTESARRPQRGEKETATKVFLRTPSLSLSRPEDKKSETDPALLSNRNFVEFASLLELCDPAKQQR